MNVYAALSFDLPTIAYCAFHQARKGMKSEEYRKTMADFHSLLRKETEAVRTEWERYTSERAAQSMQRIRGLLSQFLATPLKSDSAEVERIIAHELSEHTARILAPVPPGLAEGTEGIFRFSEDAKGTFGRLQASGRKYLGDLGFQIRKGHPEIFESCFVIQGAQNLDVLEHLVRDRIGIYTPVHGKHIKEFEGYSYVAFNRIYESRPKPVSGRREASVFFSKGATHNAPFRNGIAEMLDRMQEEHSFPRVSVWQRKLGLGVGKEFVLRLEADEASALEDAINSLLAYDRKGFVRDSLKNGHLLVKEFLPT